MTGWGESHGPAIGCVVDGCPPCLPLSEADIQPFLDKRRPGTSRFVTQRREPDTVRILSGVFEGQTTGHPIHLMIENEDARSKDYTAQAQALRPGHADYAWRAKYGIHDHRGGGRASARETAVRVAAGAIARIVLGPAITIRAALVAVGGDAVDRSAWDWDETQRNPFWAPDAAAAARWEAALDTARKNGTSLGAIIEVVAEGVPPGWGSPVYAKLDAMLAGALMGINAVKAVEIGSGFAAAALDGRVSSDEMRGQPYGSPAFLSNHAGGIVAGVSTGQPIVARIALKPTASIPTPLRTVDTAGEDAEIRTTGRHDPCVGLRAAPIAEAMLALVLADAMLEQRTLGR